MSDTDFDDIDDLDQEEVEARNPAREQQRKTEKELKAAKQALKEASEKSSEGEQAKRELAFIKAGIDTNNPTAKLLLKTYDGELSMEAIKASGEEYGLIATSQTTQVAGELNQINQIANAGQGSSTSVPTSVVDEIKGATSPAEVLAVYAKNNMSVSYEEPGELFSVV
jgi:hypothetical protein